MGSTDRANRATGGSLPFWCYLVGVSVLGGGVAAAALATLRTTDLTGPGAPLWVLVALLVGFELRPLVTAGIRDAGGVSISVAFVFAILLFWGLPLAILATALAITVEGVVHRREYWRTSFNVAQYTLSYASAALVLSSSGLHASVAAPQRVTGGALPLTLLAALAFFIVNDVLVASAIALSARESLRKVLRRDFGYHLVTTMALLALSPLVVVSLERSSALVPLLILPIVAVYKAADISLEKERQSLHDVLTGLPNRQLLMIRADAALAASVLTGRQFALLLLDLDRFKEVNDTLGHAVGDRLLQDVSGRFQAAMRTGDTVARLGGDEFAVLLYDVADAADALAAAQRLLAAMAQSFELEGLLLDLEVSIGVAIFPAHGEDVDTLLRRADVAMYTAKEHNCGVAVYDQEKDVNSPGRLRLLSELRRALDQGDLILHYQPKYDLATGAVAGVEALVRWAHPERGLLMAEEFIPLAERTGLIAVLTANVFEQAARQAAEWAAAGLPLRVAVNVSGRDLLTEGFAQRVEQVLDRHSLPGNALQVEIAERVLMSDGPRAHETIRRLAALGVEVSLDDFGVGYSSLRRLTRLRVAEIKVDRSFVGRMHVDPDAATIVRSVVELGRALGLRVVATGVEHLATRDALAAMGCHQAQGFLLGAPCPGANVAEFLAITHRLPGQQDRGGRRRRGEPGVPLAADSTHPAPRP